MGAPEVEEIQLVELRPELIDALLIMWRESFEEAVGIVDWHPMEDQKRYLLSHVVPENDVRVALLGPSVVAFVAASQDWLNQLYVHRDFQRRGLGTRLLDWAKAQSSGRLLLYTFARNQRACAFYERSGFEAIERGFEKEWQLEDVKYQWSAERVVASCPRLAGTHLPT